MDVDELTERLWAARQGGDFYPAWVNDLDLDTAQAVAAGLLRKELAQGAALGGWKVGFTSARVRQAVGVDIRPFGRILAGRILSSGVAVPASSVRHPSIEAELCFTFASRLAGPGPTRDDVLAAVDTVSAGFELNERRAGSARPNVAAMITDAVTHWGIVVGQGRPVGQVDLPSVRCTLTCDGQERYTGVSADELDDHLASLAALAAGLDRYGLAVEAGQRVITGAFCRFDVEAGQRWEATYDGVGRVEMTWS